MALAGRLVAGQGFWELPRSTLFDICQMLRLQPRPGSSLFDLLWLLISPQLEVSEQECLDLCHRRVAQAAESDDVCSTLLEVDEAAAVMDRFAVDRITEAKKQVEHTRASFAAFRDDCIAKARTVSKPTGASSAQRRSNKKAKLQVLPHHIPQCQAKQFAPPDTSIWQDRARGGWCGHFTSCKRISESFDRHGGDSKSALKELLRRLWG